jgi:hypothetical protein
LKEAEPNRASPIALDGVARSEHVQDGANGRHPQHHVG